MMRSLFAGISGLKNHIVRMDVIGNNIANVNTTGFRAGRVSFQDLLSQTIRGAAAPQGGRGGINPAQVGLGVSVASVENIMTQGSLQLSGKPTDLAIQGDGFFILNDGSRDLYTRAGTFDVVDGSGNLANLSNGFIVQGWQADASGNVNTGASPGDIKIQIGQKISAKATTGADLRSNLNADAPTAGTGSTHTATIEVFDSLGAQHLVTLTFTHKAPANGTWEVNASVDGTTDEQITTGKNIIFNKNGSLKQAGDVQAPGAKGFMTLAFTPTNGANPVSMSLNFGTIGTIDGITGFAEGLNSDGTPQPSTASFTSQDGFGMGVLQAFRIDNTGTVTGSFSNGRSQKLAQAAMAVFSNPGGLLKEGDNLFTVSNNSGPAQVGTAATGGRGQISAGFLEMSNVDLSQEFVDMIVTQRGFQASSRTIQTGDEMLQVLMTLKR